MKTNNQDLFRSAMKHPAVKTIVYVGGALVVVYACTQALNIIAGFVRSIANLKSAAAGK